MKKLIPAISQDTLTLIGVLKALSDPEKTLTKAEITQAIGRNPSSLMQTATRHLREDNGLVVEYDRVHGVYRGFHGADNLLKRQRGLKSLRRKTRNEAEKLCKTDFALLNDSQKVEAAAVASTLGAIHQFTSPSAQKRIAGNIEKADLAGMPFAKTLALFAQEGK